MFRALVIEDDSDILEFIQEILSNHGFQCEGFSNPKTALELPDSKLEQFDVIFTDLLMPEMDGFEFVFQVKTRGIQTAIFALTGLADMGKEIYDAIDGKSRMLPMNIFPKPIDEEDIKTVQRLLGLHHRSSNP